MSVSLAGFPRRPTVRIVLGVPHPLNKRSIRCSIRSDRHPSDNAGITRDGFDHAHEGSRGKGPSVNLTA